MSESDIEEIIFAPIDDEDYARRIRKIREAIKFQEMKYGKVARKIAVQNFKYMFAKESELDGTRLDEDEQKVLKDLMSISKWNWETKSISEIKKMVTEGKNI